MSGDFIILNNRNLEFAPGDTILNLAKRAGVEIPTLCHLDGVGGSGNCGVCLVEVEGSDTLLRACQTPAESGMRVRTNTPRVHKARAEAIKKLVASGDHNCFVMNCDPQTWTERQVEIMQKPWHQTICPSFGNCRLQDLVVKYPVSLEGLEFTGSERILDDSHPMIVRDYSRCIGCGRCALACNHVQHNMAIEEPLDWDSESAQGWLPAVDYDKCTHCGECVQVCPVGALFEKKAFEGPLFNQTKKVRTTCPYCGVGCQLWLHVEQGRVVKVTGVEQVQPNRGRLCVKGRFGYDFIHSGERLTSPLIKENGGFREASWDEALDLVAGRFMEIKQKHGPDALAGVSCARSTNEDSYNMQKLFRAVIGTNNIDHCART